MRLVAHLQWRLLKLFQIWPSLVKEFIAIVIVSGKDYQYLDEQLRAVCIVAVPQVAFALFFQGGYAIPETVVFAFYKFKQYFGGQHGDVHTHFVL